jgi:hypothetical protein
MGGSVLENGNICQRITTFRYDESTVQALTNTTLGFAIRNVTGVTAGNFQTPSYYPFSTPGMTLSFTATFPID